MDERAPGNPFAALAAYARDVITAPFRVDPQTVLSLSVEQMERQRRKSLFRLIVFSFMLVQALAFGPILASHPPHTNIITQILFFIMSSGCLLLNARKRTTSASIIFLYGAMTFTLANLIANSNGLNIRTLIIYSLLPVFVVVAGLLLPRWMVWFTASACLVIDEVGVFTLPVGAEISSTIGRSGATHALIGAILGAPVILVAILAWIFARTSRAGIETVARAYEIERDLTILKDQFLIDANHELRTPIMAWYGSIEFLMRLGEHATAEQRQRHLERAKRTGDNVLRLLANVLDVSAIESAAPQIRPQSFALTPFIEHTLRTFDPGEIGEPGLTERLDASREARVTIPATLIAWADPERVRQIMINLLSNALKYSPTGSPIAIAAEALAPTRRRSAPRFATSQPGQDDASHPQAFLRIAVRDYGPGIPPDDIPKLFKRFVRLERDITGPVRGTGVGLYICRVLVEAMGGRIWVESAGKPGEGSTFYFTLPLAANTDETPSQAPEHDISLASAQTQAQMQAETMA